MKRFAKLFLILALPLGTACTALRSIDIGQGEYWLKSGRPLTLSESLLLYYDYARGLSTAEWARENDLLRQLSATDKSDFTRLRYALLLSLPSAGARDRARAQQLMESLTREAEGRDPALRALANLLAAELADLRRLEDSLQSATQKQKEDMAERMAERRRLEDSLQQATQRQKDEQSRSAALEQKLEALKSIEKTLNERDRKAVIPTPPPVPAPVPAAAPAALPAPGPASK